MDKDNTAGGVEIESTPLFANYINDCSLSLAKMMLAESAPSEVLHMVAALIGLSEDTIDYAIDSAADGFTLEADCARDRATNYERSAHALCKIWSVANAEAQRPAVAGKVRRDVRCSRSQDCRRHKHGCRHHAPHSHAEGCDYGTCDFIRGEDKYRCCLEANAPALGERSDTQKPVVGQEVGQEVGHG
jgi:hypothetical protein